MILPPGSKIFREGEPPSKAFMLERGSVRLSVVSKTGKKVLLRTARPGNFLGLSAILTGLPYEATAETLTAADGFFIDRLKWMHFLHAHPKKAFQTVELLSDVLTETLEHFRSLC